MAISSPSGASYLIVPATRPDRVAKATNSNADYVIVDLEDAVPAADKEQARATLSELKVDRDSLVRVNGIHTPFFAADIEAVCQWPWVRGVLIPKVETAEEAQSVRALLPSGIGLGVGIESARGIAAVDEIATAQVDRLFFGLVDYLADIRGQDRVDVLAYPRSRLVIASINANIEAPIDGPTIELRNLERVEQDAKVARGFGFVGKVCVHPSHIEIVNNVFKTSQEDLDWARRVLDHFEETGEGVFMLDDSMVDEPLLNRARHILQSE